MDIYRLFLGVLVVWRLTHLLAAEDGPWDLILRLRRTVGDGFWGELLDCFYCLSLWIAAPFGVLLGQDWTETLLLWPALSGASILLERATGHPEPAVPPAPYYEEGTEDHHELLRRRETAFGVENPSEEGHPETSTGAGIDGAGEESGRGVVSLHR